MLRHHSTCAVSNGILNKLHAIMMRSFDGNEHLSSCHASVVLSNAMHHDALHGRTGGMMSHGGQALHDVRKPHGGHDASP